jgi:hypothetical protein
MKTVAITILALALASCSTRTETVTVETQPTGATIDIGDNQVTSPATVQLATNREYHVVATKPGCPIGEAEIRQRMDWGSFALLMLVFPVGIPLGSMRGTMYTLEPTAMKIDLCPPPSASSSALQATPKLAPPAAALPATGNWEQVKPVDR